MYVPHIQNLRFCSAFILKERWKQMQRLNTARLSLTYIANLPCQKLVYKSLCGNALPSASSCAALLSSVALHGINQETIKILWGGDVLLVTRYDTFCPHILKLLYVNFLYTHQNYRFCKYNEWLIVHIYRRDFTSKLIITSSRLSNFHFYSGLFMVGSLCVCVSLLISRDFPIWVQTKKGRMTKVMNISTLDWLLNPRLAGQQWKIIATLCFTQFNRKLF